MLISGAIHRANLTPTDILHASGIFTDWSTEAAETGIEILARRYGRGKKQFIDDVLSKIGYMLFTALVEKLVSLETPGFELSCAGDTELLMNKLYFDGGTAKKQASALRFSASAALPVIGVGAPVEAYLSDVVKRMNGRFVLTENADVANAAGTVSGKVVERVKVTVKPGETGGFFVYGPEGRKILTDLNEAMEYAEASGREAARKLAERSGGYHIELETERHDRYLPLTEAEMEEGDTTKQLFVESVIETIAVGIPWAIPTC